MLSVSHYRVVPSECPSPCEFACTVFSRVSAHGRLQLTGPKTGVGTYTDKPFVCITRIYVNHRIIQKGGGRLLKRIWYTCKCPSLCECHSHGLRVHVYICYVQMTSLCKHPPKRQKKYFTSLLTVLVPAARDIEHLWHVCHGRLRGSQSGHDAIVMSG